MSVQFTVHCVPWQCCSPLLGEFRSRFDDFRNDQLPNADPTDLISQHAIALDGKGMPVGWARLTPAGTIDRILTAACCEQLSIEAALREILHRRMRSN